MSSFYTPGHLLCLRHSPYKIIIVGVLIISVFIMFNYLKPKNLKTKVLVIGDNSFSVEVVDSPESIKQGLSDRDEIGSDGMLFVFPDKSIRTFWMLRMRFDLDFVWISDDKVVSITKNVKKPALGTQDKDLEIISSNEFADKVLELNAGDIDKYGIEVGHVVILK